MTPTDLTEYINVLKAGNVLSAHLIISATEQLQVVFGPDMDTTVGTKSAPGEWKSPVNLDSNKMFESPEHDV
jgi:hypothetical protein